LQSSNSTTRSPNGGNDMLVIGQGETCDEAKRNGIARCDLAEYAHAILQPDPDGYEDGCTLMGHYYAQFLCTDN
jgi:hypothetical protein